MERRCRWCRKRIRLVPIGRSRGPVWVHVDRGAGKACRMRRAFVSEHQPTIPGLFQQELF